MTTQPAEITSASDFWNKVGLISEHCLPYHEGGTSRYEALIKHGAFFPPVPFHGEISYKDTDNPLEKLWEYLEVFDVSLWTGIRKRPMPTSSGNHFLTEDGNTDTVFSVLEHHLKALYKSGVLKWSLGPHNEHRVFFGLEQHPVALIWVHIYGEKYPNVSVCARFEKDGTGGFHIRTGIMCTPTLTAFCEDAHGTEIVVESDL